MQKKIHILKQKTKKMNNFHEENFTKENHSWKMDENLPKQIPT